MCDAHPWGEPIGLDCQRTDSHVTGHSFVATWAPDRHDFERDEDS